MMTGEPMMAWEIDGGTHFGVNRSNGKRRKTWMPGEDYLLGKSGISTRGELEG